MRPVPSDRIPFDPSVRRAYVRQPTIDENVDRALIHVPGLGIQEAEYLGSIPLERGQRVLAMPQLPEAGSWRILDVASQIAEEAGECSFTHVSPDPGADTSPHTFMLHPSGNWIFTGNLEVWPWTGSGWGARAANPTINNMNSNPPVAVSPDGNWIAYTRSVSPFVEVRPFNQSTGAIGSPVSNPATLPPSAFMVKWTPDGNYIIVSTNHGTTQPPVVAWEWTGTGFGSKVADPADISDTSGTGVGLAISPQGNAVVISKTGSGVHAWQWTGSGWGSRYTDLVGWDPTLGTGKRPAFPQFNAAGTIIGFTDDLNDAQNHPAHAVSWSSGSGFGTLQSAPKRDWAAQPSNPSSVAWHGTTLFVPYWHGSFEEGAPFLLAYTMSGASFNDDPCELLSTDDFEVGDIVYVHPDGQHIMIDTWSDIKAYEFEMGASPSQSSPAAPITAATVTYTPNTPADWDGSPITVQQALDELAARVRILEGLS